VNQPSRSFPARLYAGQFDRITSGNDFGKRRYSRRPCQRENPLWPGWQVTVSTQSASGRHFDLDGACRSAGLKSSLFDAIHDRSCPTFSRSQECDSNSHWRSDCVVGIPRQWSLNAIVNARRQPSTSARAPDRSPRPFRPSCSAKMVQRRPPEPSSECSDCRSGPDPHHTGRGSHRRPSPLHALPMDERWAVSAQASVPRTKGWLASIGNRKVARRRQAGIRLAPQRRNEVRRSSDPRCQAVDRVLTAKRRVLKQNGYSPRRSPVTTPYSFRQGSWSRRQGLRNMFRPILSATVTGATQCRAARPKI
jgi:hypothetical protein